MREFTIRGKPLLVLALCAAFCATAAPTQAESQLDQVLDAIVANERLLAQRLESYHPLIETYLQTVRPDATLGSVPVKDNYFIGRLELRPIEATAKGDRRSKKALSLLEEFNSFTVRPESLAPMLLLDRGAFDREHYEFEFMRAEFLGEVRTLVFDVTPKRGKRPAGRRNGQFTGRIWVEDADYHVVRYNGNYDSASATNFHFDSWRLSLPSGGWLPAYVYMEEAGRTFKQFKLTHKGQTRIWGYDVRRRDAEDEFTRILIEGAETNDPTDRPGRTSPVESARSWEREAEGNVLRRLERAGLLAPEGEVDTVLETVVTNLEITNSLEIEPPVRCRVLLTTPLESFTVGHTIVISRGLLDVLPNEASLAMVLAHGLGHILLGHELDTRYAFSDRMMIGDREAMKEFLFVRSRSEEQEADDRAVTLLENSPYKDDLGQAGLFLKALNAGAAQLSALNRPHFGNSIVGKDRLQRMVRIAEAAPELEPASLDQLAALPLGGRIQLDPWSARIELMKNNRVPLVSAREKMPFQITPLMPYLARSTDETETDADETIGAGVEPDRPGLGSD